MCSHVRVQFGCCAVVVILSLLMSAGRVRVVVLVHCVLCVHWAGVSVEVCFVGSWRRSPVEVFFVGGLVAAVHGSLLLLGVHVSCRC